MLGTNFWDEYKRFMESTFQNTQKMLENMNFPNFNGLKQGEPTEFFNNPPWAGVADINKTATPDIKVQNDKVTVTFKVSDSVNNNNTQVYLIGNCLIVEGSIQAKIPLPENVQKYGGKANYNSGTLRIELIRDIYSKRTPISIEIE